MLKVKSFKITDDVGVNGLLSKYQLAVGMHILVANGEVMIPYEDGTEKSLENKIISMKEERNTLQAKVDFLIHAQTALGIKNEGIKSQIAKLESVLVNAGGVKSDYDNNKNNEKEIKRLQGVLTQNENQVIMNQAEITHYMANIEAHTTLIAQLEK